MKLSGLIGVAFLAGAAAAGYAYYKKYKQEHEDLEEDFREFEDEDAPQAQKETYTDPNKKYTSLNANKEEFVDAAKATLETAKGMVPPAKHMAKDIAEIVSEKSSDASIIANDCVTSIKERVNNFIDSTKDKVNIVEEDVLNDYKEDTTTDDVIIDIDASGNIKKDAF